MADPLLEEIKAARGVGGEDLLSEIAKARLANKTQQPEAAPKEVNLLDEIKAARGEQRTSFENPFDGIKEATSKAIKGTVQFGKELAAKNIEKLGFDTAPFRAIGESISPKEERILPEPAPLTTSRSGILPDENYSPLKETISEVVKEAPARLIEEVSTLPAFMLQYAILGPVSRFLKLPVAAQAVTKPLSAIARTAGRVIPGTAGRVATNIATRVAAQAPEAMGTFALQSGLGEAAEEGPEGETGIEKAKRIATSAGTGAALGLVGEGAFGALAGLKEARAVKKGIASLEGRKFQTTEETFNFLKDKGVPAREAAQMAEKTASSNVLYPVLKESTITSRAAQAVPIEAPTNPIISNFENRVRGRLPEVAPLSRGTSKSLSESVRDAGGIDLAKSKVASPVTGTTGFKEFSKTGGMSLEEMQSKMASQGYPVGKTTDEFAMQLVADQAASKAGFRGIHRIYPEGKTPFSLDPIEAEKAYRAYGVSEPVAQRVGAETAKKPMSPMKQAKTLEKAIAETDKNRALPGDLLPDEVLAPKPPRSGEIQYTAGPKGNVSVLRGEKDLGHIAEKVMWAPEVARLHPEFRPIAGAARNLYQNVFPNMQNGMSGWQQRFSRTLSKNERLNVMKALEEESERTLSFTPSELLRKGFNAEQLEMYETIRPVIKDIGAKMKELGYSTKDIFTHVPHMWRGKLRIIGPRGDGTVGTLTRVETEKEALAFAENYLKANPKATLTVTNPVEVPDSYLAMLPKEIRKKFIKTVREDLGKGEVNVTTETLQAVKGRGERFFGPIQKRSVGLDTYEKDPLKWFPQYVSQWNRKLALDEFNKVANSAMGQMDPMKRNLGNYTRSFVDFINNPNEASDGIVSKVFHAIDGIPGVKKAMNVISKYEAIAKLGFNPLSPAVNFLEVWWNTHTILGSKDTANGFRHMLNLTDGKTNEINRRVIKDLGVDQAFGGTNMFDEFSKLSGQGKIDPLWLFKISERAMRGITGLGAFHKVYKKTGNYDQALKYAEEVVDRAHMWISAAHVPPYMRSTASRFLLQFKQYPLKEMEFFNSLTAKEKAYFTAKVLATTGVAGIPFIGDKESILKLKAEHPEIARGAFGVMGMDNSENISPLTSMIPEKAEIGEIFGPGVSDIAKIYTAIKTKDPRDIRKATRAVTPVMMNRLMDVAKELQTGMYHYPTTGEAVAPVTKKEALLSGIGIRPIQIGAVSAAKRLEQKREEKLKVLRRQAIEAAAEGRELTPEQQEAFANAASLNRSVRDFKKSQEIPLSERLPRDVRKKDREEIQNILQRYQRK